jgi:hypothetical protein
MTLQVIGVGRTGTCSLKLALEHLGIGPCHHVDLAAVRTSLPPERLLVFDVEDSWQPLCAFLDRPVAAMPFPRTNNSEEFWDLARQLTG